MIRENPPVMEFLLSKTDQNPDIAQVLYSAMRDKWPQLHPNSKLARVPKGYHSCMLPILKPEPAQWRFPKKWVTRNYMLIWKHHPPYVSMDNPELRWAYQSKILSSPFKTLHSLFWRGVGRLFNRQDWQHRGMIQVEDIPFSAPAIESEKVELETLGFRDGWESYVIRVGYSARLDVLCVGE